MKNGNTKKLSLYTFTFLFTLATVSKAEVFIKCDHISGSFDKKIVSELEYLQLADSKSDREYRDSLGVIHSYKKSFYNWDKKEQIFKRSARYYTKIQEYKIYGIYDGKDFKKSGAIDRETGILTFSGNTFQCDKINKSDLPITKVIQKF